VIKIEKQEEMLTFTGVFATILFHTTEKHMGLYEGIE